MSFPTWPDLATYQQNALGQLTNDQRKAFDAPLPFAAYIAFAFLFMIFPGFILTAFGTLYLPVILPTILFHGNSSLDAYLQLALFFVLLVVVALIAAILFPSDYKEHRAAVPLFGAWFIFSIAATVVLGIYAGGFLFYYSLVVLAIEIIVAITQIRVAYRLRLSRRLPIETTEGEVRWYRNRYVGVTAQLRLRPMSHNPQILPGRYRFHYFGGRLAMLLSAEPLDTTSLAAVNAPLQESLFAALHFTASDLFLHQLGRLAPAQQRRLRYITRRDTVEAYFSSLGLTWLAVFFSCVALIILFLINVPQFPVLVFPVVGIALLVSIPPIFAHRAWAQDRAREEAEHIISWEGEIKKMRLSWTSGKISYPHHDRLMEFYSDEGIIGYLPERSSGVFIADRRYRIYMLNSTHEIVSAEPIPDA